MHPDLISSANQARSARVRGALRVLAYLICVSAISSPLLASFARAHVGERLTRGGVQLLEALGPRFLGEPQAVSINGQPMFLSSKRVGESVAEVLDEFQRYCAAGAPASVAPAGLNPYTWLRSRLEAEDGNQGHIACLVPSEGVAGLEDLLERGLAFAQSGDLAEIGAVRYAVARRDAASNSTHVLAMWTEGSFDVLAMFPEAGDAPGDDAADLPRPLASRRVLSARVPGRPYSLRFYDSEETHSAVLEAYGRGMTELGWQPLPLPVAPGVHDMNQNVRLFSRDGRAVIVTVSDTPAGKTGVSLLEMEGTGFVHASARAAVSPF